MAKRPRKGTSAGTDLPALMSQVKQTNQIKEKSMSTIQIIIEMTELLHKLGVKVVTDAALAKSCNGVFSPSQKRISLSPDLVSRHEKVLETLAHEATHVIQHHFWKKRGDKDRHPLYTYSLLGVQPPTEIVELVDLLYLGRNEFVRQVEYEAFTLQHTPELVLSLLKGLKK